MDIDKNVITLKSFVNPVSVKVELCVLILLYLNFEFESPLCLLRLLWAIHVSFFVNTCACLCLFFFHWVNFHILTILQDSFYILDISANWGSAPFFSTLKKCVSCSFFTFLCTCGRAHPWNLRLRLSLWGTINFWIEEHISLVFSFSLTINTTTFTTLLTPRYVSIPYIKQFVDTSRCPQVNLIQFWH